MSTEIRPTPRPRRLGDILLEFLGSMNLAISLLVVIGIASAIGTVLKQNEPYNNYKIKFGDFWFEVFRSLDLYDIYGSNWFLLLLGFLLLSTSVCVARNAPRMLHEMRTFRFNVQEKSLRAFHHHDEWHSHAPHAELVEAATALMGHAGYRVKGDRDGAVTTLAGLRGMAGRIGYILSHTAIVVICLGGLLDGNIPLKLAEFSGELKPELRDMPANEVPAISTLGTDNHSFRGSVSIPEGARANFVFLQLRDGYLKQELPFTVALQDFRIEHYSTGMPKSFESDLIIYDDQNPDAEPLHQTIRVNHPLIYNGYAIYQSSFSDGGSKLKLAAWSFDAPEAEPFIIDSAVNRSVDLETPRGDRRLELTEFKAFNIFPLPEGDPSGKKHRNYGPSITFKVRRPNGTAFEYQNYMLPIEQDGARYYLTGMRATPSDQFGFLHLPLDRKGSLERFMHFLARVHDRERLNAAIANETSSAVGDERAEQVNGAIAHLAELFLDQGIDALIAEMEEKVEPEQRQAALDAYIKVIQGVFGTLYLEVLEEEGIDLSQDVTAADTRFFDDSMTALSTLAPYGSPFYLELKSFEQVEASGLQITKSPGKDIVYLGSALLIAGIFFMFYLHPRKLWLRIVPDGDGSRLLLAGNSVRNHADFDAEFDKLRAQLRRASGAGDLGATADERGTAV